MSVQMRPNEDHEVLGSEYCSGYTDTFGKWNTGFYCPTAETTGAVYCCGTGNYKYCCTKKGDQGVHHEIPNLMLYVGAVAGSLLAVVMVTAVSCFFCTCCVLYKRRHTSMNGGPLYQMHCSSTGSGVANMYSFSNQNSSVTTPVDTGGPHHTLSELDYPQTPPLPLPLMLPLNGTSSSSPAQHQLMPHSFSADTPHLRRAVTMDPCAIPAGYPAERSLSPCLLGSSSPSMSISFRDVAGGPKGHPVVDIRRLGSCSPPSSTRQPSSTTVSPPLRNNSLSSSVTNSPPPAPPEEGLYRSTKF